MTKSTKTTVATTTTKTTITKATKAAIKVKKKGVGIFAPKALSDSLAAICGGKKMPRTEVTKKIWVYIKKNNLNTGRTIKPDATLNGDLPGCEPGHAQDAGLHQQAPVLRPWES